VAQEKSDREMALELSGRSRPNSAEYDEAFLELNGGSKSGKVADVHREFGFDALLEEFKRRARAESLFCMIDAPRLSGKSTFSARCGVHLCIMDDATAWNVYAYVGHSRARRKYFSIVVKAARGAIDEIRYNELNDLAVFENGSKFLCLGYPHTDPRCGDSDTSFDYARLEQHKYTAIILDEPWAHIHGDIDVSYLAWFYHVIGCGTAIDNYWPSAPVVNTWKPFSVCRQ